MSAAGAVAIGLALKAAIILALGLALGSLLGRASATSRHFLWSGILLGALALPLLTAVLPVWEPIAWPSTVRVERADLMPDTPAPAPRPAKADEMPTAPAATPAPDAPPRSEAPARSAAWLWRWAGAIAAGGAGVFLVLLGRSVRRLRRIVRAGRRVPPDDRRRARLDGRARALGLPTVPRIVESPATSVPFVWGVLRPAIVLPPASAGWSDARLDAVLLHELAHIRHRDVPVRLAAETVCALHWFNPLAWAAARRLRAAGEAACDDAVLAAGVPPADYAGELLGLSVEQQWHLRAAGAMAGTSPIGRRIEGILDPGRRRSGSTRARWATAAGLLGLVLPIAAFAPATQEAAPAFAPGAEPLGGPGLPVQFRFQTSASAGVVFTQGPVELGAAGRSANVADPGFLLVVTRDGRGALRTAWTTSSPTSAGRVRDEAGDRAWPAREPGWLDAAIRLSAQRLGRLGSVIRWHDARLDSLGAGARLSASGSVMTGLPATTEDGGRGILVAGWSDGSLRAGLFACGEASGGPDADAARSLLRRVARSGSLDALERDECMVVYTWDAEDGRLRLTEAWREGAGPLRMRASDGDRALSRAEAERWVADLLPAAIGALQ